MSFLNVKNRAKSTLAADITATDTSLTVAAGEGDKFPTSNFHFTLEKANDPDYYEICLCTSRAGDVLTIERAKEETTAKAHSSGSKVQLRITAGIVQELQQKKVNPTDTPVLGQVAFWNNATDIAGENDLFWDKINKRLGVKKPAPEYDLDINGTVNMIGFRMPTGAAAGRVLTSDANGVGTWQAGGGGVTWPLLAPSGSAGAPSYSFSGDTDIGMYRSNPDSIGFATGGTLRFTITNTGVNPQVAIQLIDGAVGTPSLTFANDTDTGITRLTWNEVAIISAGSAAARISMASLYTAGPIWGPDGSPSAPTYTFNNDQNTGMFRFAEDRIGFTTNGSTRLIILGEALWPYVPIRPTWGGSASNPPYSFSGHTSTGMYLPDTATLCFSTNAAERLRISSWGLIGMGRTPATNRLEVEGNASKTTAGSWLANSDRNIKTDIQDIEGAIETIKRLRPRKFRYKEEYRKLHDSIQDREYYNFISQEYQEVFPDDVKGTGEKFEDKEILQMDAYSAQIVLFKAVQELIEKVEELEKKIK